jgi:hypothetical protein
MSDTACYNFSQLGLAKSGASATAGANLCKTSPHYFAVSPSLSGTGLPTSELTLSGAAASARAESRPASFTAARMGSRAARPVGQGIGGQRLVLVQALLQLVVEGAGIGHPRPALDQRADARP